MWKFGIVLLLTVAAVSSMSSYDAGQSGSDNDVNVADDIKESVCAFYKQRPACKKSKYRTIDGSCNNKAKPRWGTPYSTFSFLVYPEYGDGEYSLQTSVNGRPLPSARVISKACFSNFSVPDLEYTIAMMQFGQIMAHDMSFGLGGSGKSHCTAGFMAKDAPSSSVAIPIPKNDPMYSSVNWNCMAFTRDVIDHDLQCRPTDELRRQVSTTTLYLDLSLTYGETQERADMLREFKDGLLKTKMYNGEEYPPQDPDSLKHCFVSNENEACFLSSDERVNSNPQLALIQVLYVREHNRIARELAKLNPSWDDEKLYQEARRINIAQYQYVSYYEWLPLYLGEENMKVWKMIYDVSGGEYVNDYRPKQKPRIYNEHSNAAYRLFHTQIQGQLELMSENRNVIDTVPMSDIFFKPQYVVDNFDDLARGLVTQQCQATDKNYDSEVMDLLFKHNRPYGDDLRAIDIQRARDHGIPRYNDARELCDFPRAKKWKDYSDFIAPEDIENLKKVYRSFEDVELAVGGALERIVDNTTLSGPTMLCILNWQFKNTRVTDRYWFESGDPEVRFTKPQLAEIRKSSFARLFCDNTKTIRSIQKKAFDIVEDINPIVPCSEIPVVDLSKWKE